MKRKTTPGVMVIVQVTVLAQLPSLTEPIDKRLQRLGWKLISRQRGAKSVTYEYSVNVLELL